MLTTLSRSFGHGRAHGSPIETSLTSGRILGLRLWLEPVSGFGRCELACLDV